MLKYRCRGCGQNIVVVERVTGPEHTCPRCSTVNRPGETVEPARDEQAVMADVLTRAQAAQQRRLEEEARQATERDAALAHELDKRRQEEARIARLGSTPREPGRRSGLTWVFAAVVVVLLSWAGLAAMFSESPAKDSDEHLIAAGLDLDPKLARRVEGWVRAIAGRLSYREKPVYPYQVRFDSVEREGGSVLLIKGVVHLADRELTAQEQAARTQIEQAKDESKDRLTRREELREGMSLLRDTYDPDRMAGVAGHPAAPPDGGAKPVQTSASESLRKAGIDVAADARELPAPTLGLDLARPFTCMVRSDASVDSYPGGAALEYFVWDEQLADGTIAGLESDAKEPVKAQLDQLLNALARGDHEGAAQIGGYSGRNRELLFPAYYQPASWRIVSCDINRSGVIRAFVCVTDKSPSLSGTWILTVRKAEADRPYRVADVWRTEP